MEDLRADQRGEFSALVRQAAASLHAVDRKLAVYVPRPGPVAAAAYDWQTSRATPTCCWPPATTNTGRAAVRPVTTARGFDDIVDRALDAAGPRKAVPLLGALATAGRRAGAAS